MAIQINTTTEDLKHFTEKAREMLWADVLDRRGFRQTWDGLDKDIREEIEKAHRDILWKAVQKYILAT